MRLSERDLEAIPHVRLHAPVKKRRWHATGISIDSRITAPGDLFVALHGERFDGHQFVQDVLSRGAAGVVVDHADGLSIPPDALVLVVEDTTRALGALATRYRNKFDIPILAVAGSNGKTTTKDMITRVLASAYTVLSTEGNLNNHIGVPLTLFRLDRSHEIAVVEVGTNHPGELTALCGILQPTHALLTNIGREHLEFFGSLETVASEEGSIWAALPTGNTRRAFVNADDPLVVRTAQNIRSRLTFGFRSRSADVRGMALRVGEDGCARFRFRGTRMKNPMPVTMAVPGRHQAANALAAAAVGLTMRVPPGQIRTALESFHASSKRMEVGQVGGVTILNDTYNANPDSTIAALHTLASMQTTGKRIAVLGDMLELGAHSVEEHTRVGRAAAAAGVDYLLTFGTWAQHIQRAAEMPTAVHYDQKNVLAEYLLELVAPGDLVLLKGSRGMKMEEILTFLRQRLSPADTTAV